MKTKLTLEQETYPILMISEYHYDLVLFFKHREGVLIENAILFDIDNSNTEIGSHSSCWPIDEFTKLQGTNTIFFYPKESYPKYKKERFSELIVLFQDEETGIVMHPNKKHNVGFYSSTWFQRDFEDATGELVMSN